MANINTFKGVLSSGRDLAKANRYRVAFNIPTAVPGNDLNRELTFLCETAELPGRALNVQDYRYYGPNFKMPSQSAYTDINLTLYVRSFMRDKMVFDNWLEYINPKTTYDFRFRNEYSTDLEIFQYEERDSTRHSYKVTLQKAYPINVNPMPLAWAEDNIHRLQVTFCYVDWRKEFDPRPVGQSTLDGDLRAREDLARNLSYLETILPR